MDLISRMVEGGRVNCDHSPEFQNKSRQFLSTCVGCFRFAAGYPHIFLQ